jgi:hypothetical protein
VNKVVPQANGDSAKVKVKLRVNIHGMFNVASASMVEKAEQENEVNTVWTIQHSILFWQILLFLLGRFSLSNGWCHRTWSLYEQFRFVHSDTHFAVIITEKFKSCLVKADEIYPFLPNLDLAEHKLYTLPPDIQTDLESKPFDDLLNF